MLKRKLIRGYGLLISTFFSVTLPAQTIENSINLYGSNFPREKIHMHFDKEAYLPGETIWFKAYLFEENLPSERSTNFYAVLYNESGKLLQQQICPIFGSTSDGYFVVPDSVQSTQLICRAYTSWMLNFDTTMLFGQAIKIINDKAKVESKSENKTTALHFFPEGGDIIEGAVNTIAFKANYSDGLPFYVQGVIKKQETGEVLFPLTVLHDGMGKFDLDFQPGDKYYAEWIDNTGVTQRIWLPDAKPLGVSLKLTVQKDKLYFNLINKSGADSLHVLMYMYQKVFYKTNIKVAATEPFTGSLPISSLPAGTMQLTVFDANWQPVAERVAFISNNNFVFDAALNAKLMNTDKREKNILEISVADTIPANMSLSISDADANNVASENTILSDLLLKGDIKGYVHNPAFYFADSADASLKSKLDLVMLTHGWRRYSWADMSVRKMPVIKYPADEYLGVYGRVGADVMNNIEKEERVNLVIKTADSSNYFYSLIPDRAGLLKQTGLVFYDSARVYFSFNKDKINNSQIAFSRYNFTNPPLSTLNNYKNFLMPDTTGLVFNASTALFQYYVANNGIKKFSDEKTLTNVTIRTGGRSSWRNNPLLKMDEKYTTGMFRGGGSGYSLDVLHDEKAWTRLDIDQYLRTEMPFLRIGRFNINERINSYNAAMLIFIDEHQVTESDLENLSLLQVAYIKFIPNYFGGGFGVEGGAIRSALSVYTRKGDDMIDRRPTDKDLRMVKIAGYSPVKEFYSPDYAESKITGGTDARSTLLWMPYILTDKTNHKIPVIFYNNDLTKRMRIVLEGINDEGKMIRIEKIIE
jgi:hypothetical protein